MRAIKQYVSCLLALFAVVVGAFTVGAAGAQSVVTTITFPITGLFSASNPGALAVNAATNRIYVVDGDLLGASVRVIDGATNKLIATIAIDTTSILLPVGDIAIDTALNRIYVSNRQTNTLAVIDGATNTVLAKVPVGRSPDHIAVNTHTHRVYTANFTDASVTAVDGATGTVIATIPASAGSATPAGVSIAVDEDADRIYVGGVTAATVSVIDGASNAIVRTVATGGTGAVTLAVNKSLHKAYAANFQDKTVAVIDGVSFATTSLPTGRSSYSLAVNLATNRVYVAGIGDGIVTVIDGPTDAVVATVPIGNSHAVAPNSVTNQIFLPNRASNNVTVIEGSTNTVLPPVPAGNFPDFIAINEATNRIYVANTQGGSITVIAGGGGTPTPVDVIEFYNASLDHYFITYGAQEISDLDTGVHKGWARTAQSFKAYVTPQSGTSPVCRFYIPPGKGDSHFFGRGTVECNATGAAHPDFDLEDPAFMQMFLPVAGVCPANTTEVYRVFSNRADANHRYMTDPAIRDQMAGKGWTIEGDGPHFVVMCAPM